MSKPKSSSLLFSKNSFKNELNTYPILIPDTTYVNFSIFFFLVVGGSQKSKNIFQWYLKIISTRVCKKSFLIKAKIKKNILVLGVPKMLSEGINKIFREKKFHRGIRNQIWDQSRIFWVKGKKPHGSYAVQRPPPQWISGLTNTN